VPAVTGTSVARLSGPSSVLLHDDLESYRRGTWWEDSSVHGKWRSMFDGFGHVGVVKVGSKVLTLAPKAPEDASETHAALATTRNSFGDMVLRLRMKTVKQLRAEPNPWEVAWAMWHREDNDHFYYLILKPKRWELGKADPAYPGGQRFLRTGYRSFPVHEWHRIRVRHVGRRVKVWADGRFLTRFVDRERPYRSGTVAVYSEDAKTYFDDLLITRP
jgi:Domain of Unknown Function (DUF1080)